MRVLMCGVKNPLAWEHFQQTVLHPVKWAGHVATLAGTQEQLLRVAHGDEARFWGIVPDANNKRAADELAPGDQVWFHRDNQVRWVATVVTVFKNPALARSLWDEKPDGRTWSLVFTVTEPQEAAIPKDEVTARVGFGRGMAWQYAALLTEAQSRRLPLVLSLGPVRS
jgi:hypothetical protein